MPAAKKRWLLIDRDLRRAAAVLSGLMLAGMFLETLGLGLVVPALALLMQQDPVAKYPAMASWLGHLGNPTREQLAIFGMFFLVGVYAVKALFLAFLAWRQSWFVGRLQASLGQRLFAGYLKQPYTFHLQRNSAQLIRNTIHQLSSFAATFQQELMLLTEALVTGHASRRRIAWCDRCGEHARIGAQEITFVLRR